MKVVIGCDINEYSAQISYAKEGGEPETLELSTSGDPFELETALCKRNGVNQWYLGREAVKKALSGQGSLVEHLLPLLIQGKPVEIEGTHYEVIDLYNLFLRKALLLAIQKIEEAIRETAEVEALVLTACPWEKSLLSQKEKLIHGLLVPEERIFFQSHEESLYSFLVHQPQKLWGYVTLVLDLTAETMAVYRVEMNHKTRPIVTFVKKTVVSSLVRQKHYASIMENDAKLAQLDEALLAYLEEETRGQIVTSMYLVGDGFHGEWYPKSLKFMCRNRKVFAGNNLYSKGACLRAMERTWAKEAEGSFLFLGQDMLTYNIGVQMQDGGEEVYVPLLDAGTNWFEAQAELTFTMDRADALRFLITPIRGAAAYEETIRLDGYEGRKERTFRFHMKLHMHSEQQVIIEVRDEGFGDFYPPKKEPFLFELTLAEAEREDE